MAGVEQCDAYTSSAKTPEPMKNFAGARRGVDLERAGQILFGAIEPATTSGLIFFGDDDGSLWPWMP